MAVELLSDDEREIVRQCMVAIADGPFLDGPEFHTRLGISSGELKEVLSRWPAADDANLVTQLAINNCLNEVCHGLNISEEDWGRWFNVAKREVKRIFLKWIELKGFKSGGIR